ncbi:MAG: hypothetical protein ACM3SY_08005 [Candidatus Omnitrophota bacterium]
MEPPNPFIHFIQRRVKRYGLPSDDAFKAPVEAVSLELARLHRTARAEARPLRLVLLGKSGSGKTTLLRWLARECAPDSSCGFAGFIPVWLSLKRFEDPSDSAFPLSDIRQLIPFECRGAFDDNTILFLLDDWEAVTDASLRRDLLRWVICQDIRQNALILTSRLMDMMDMAEFIQSKIPLYALQDFDPVDIRLVLDSFPKSLREGILESAHGFKLLTLASNPLLLTLMVALYGQQVPIPDQRHRLVSLYLARANAPQEHAMFQDFHRARELATTENPYAILAPPYLENAYWNETFGFFTNLTDTRRFVHHITENLLTRGYWKSMTLWEDCLIAIDDDELRTEMELMFARAVLNLLGAIDDKPENEALVTELYAHYPLYKHAEHVVSEAWALFHHARHPFVRSVGSSILNKSDAPTQEKFIDELKNRLKDLDAMTDRTPECWLHRLYRHNNSFLILITGRKDMEDFRFVLERLKSRDGLTAYLALESLVSLDREHPEQLFTLSALPFPHEVQYPRHTREIRDTRYIPDIRDMRYLRLIGEFAWLRTLGDAYASRYRDFFTEHRVELDALVDRTAAELQALKTNTETLLTYFPATGLVPEPPDIASDQIPRG